ncbi:hypothetical protein chiPu_0000136 [Chiloscyllium punctatum]|uniref:MAM domain-containing protein n=1 Tax=Chiloscyllium punctatum TaxID=137246 RepID=A0A401RS36_CHIPU|nr:hypothetical protein [Chiloscyllium punctatum]
MHAIIITFANYTLCNFESGFCEWMQLPSNGSVWVRGQGRTSSGLGLSITDHTTNTSQGMFIYFKATSEHKSMHTIQLGIPVLKNQLVDGLPCQLRIWYQITEGANMSVYIKTTAGGQMKRAADLITPTNKGWAKVEISVEAHGAETMGPFQFLLQGSVLGMPNAFIALDDMSLTPGCVVPNAMLPTAFTEHKGHFMFILNNESNLFQIAELKSPQLSQSGTGCTMHFWYYNYGQAVGAAKMYLVIDGVPIRTVVWRTYNTQYNQWLQGSVQLGRLTRPFHLTLVKVSLSIYDGVAAMDDITFVNCSLPPAVDICEDTNQFWCKDTRACIDRLQLCDLIDDCGDGSDEDNCGK